MTKLSKVVWQGILVVVVTGVGILAARGLASRRVLPEPQARDVMAPLVEVITARVASVPMDVTGYGTVEPRMRVQVVPQVSGRVVSQHSEFVAGGFFDVNTPLVVIDPRDYRIALRAAEASVAQAEARLASEEAEAEVAKREWRTIHPGKEPDSILVFREPQVRSAQVQLGSAQAQLERAQLDLERTELSMPFDGRVVEVSVDIGQFVSQGQPIGSVYGTDAVEISVPLKDEDLAWFTVPGFSLDAAPGVRTPVRVSATFAGGQHTWQGRIVRMKSQVDARSRLAHVIVQVVDPLGTESGQVPLLPGVFVEVAIQGTAVDNVISVPRHAIRDGRDVWVARDETAEEAEEQDLVAGDLARCQRLARRPVTILRQDRTMAYLTAGLTEGELVITTPLDTVTEGMKVRVKKDI